MLQERDIAGIGMTSQRTRGRLIERLIQQGICDKRVLDIMRSTPRHLFVDEALAQRAYEDAALPIGFNQTLSQPYTVARMTELLLEGGPLGRVLEIGSGSGYQTAVLAQLVGQVIAVERIAALVDRARQRLRALGLNNIALHHADGSLGLAPRGPYDAILCAAAPQEIPPQLLEQLKIGGRLVSPVGDANAQQLCMMIRTIDGVETQHVEAVRFVPMVAGLQRR